ncbi:uncharacterized protein KY384_001976 [Bacidia gigantensis]|uniref:uncharacterized protein n=1 Tax=Bacidia gigantensis TaxID=2732470 RepID=UPI001D042D6C|nr:uncharacterized protein KY384_001976 [Bacidia gigantensis]KAG8533193.1 hypothetical protein KY384_001976 [Bacidia gigantensis]
MLEKAKYVMADDADGDVDVQADPDEDERAGRATLWDLFNFSSKEHALPLSLALILSIASGFVIPILAIYLGKLFDQFTSFGAGQVSADSLKHKVLKYSITLCSLGGVSGVLNGAFYALWLMVGELQAKTARETLFAGMLSREMEWYDKRTSGVEALVSRLQTQIRELQTATSQPLGFALQNIVTSVAALGISFYYAWSLTLVTLAAVPASAIFLAWISASMQPAVDAHTTALTHASKMATNALLAIDTVKCFNGQDQEIWQYSKAISRAARSFLIQARANAFQIGLVRLVTMSMFVQGFWYGSHLVNIGKKKPGDIVTAFMSALMAAQAVEQILPQLLVLENGKVAGATLKLIHIHIERGRRVTRMLGSHVPPHCDGDIEIRNLSFSYPSRPSQSALEDVNLFFAAGETTFVVGRSGSGKSTLSNLLLRYYAPTTGDLLLDGNPLQLLDLHWLRNNITLVQQQSVLFNETIFRNIALGRQRWRNVSLEEVKESVRLALLQGVVQDLPQGLETNVGIGGNAMSGGQKQRIAIARAHFRDTPILILDEATSALDHTTKILVVEAIREWRRGKTTIIITHDMSQVLDHDFVYVMEHGQVVQEGFKHTLDATDTLSLNAMANREDPLVQDPNSDVLDDDELIRRPIAPDEPMDVDKGSTREPRFVPSMFNSPKVPNTSIGSPIPLSPFSPTGFNIGRPMVLSPKSPRFRSITAHTTNSDLIQMSNLFTGSKTQFRDFPIPRISGRAADRRKSRRAAQGDRLSTALRSIDQGSSHRRIHNTKRKSQGTITIRSILQTVWPSLTLFQRLILILGFIIAAVHAAATPMFSWVFAKLLDTLIHQEGNPHSAEARKWSISILAVAAVDAVASFSMHYLLEYCSQCWIDSVRVEALKRIFDQPKSWFELEKNKLEHLMECLDRNAEEMRNLLGRFAGFVFVAVVMISVAIIWSLSLSWKFTLVGLASSPFMYGVTRCFEVVSSKWESKSNNAGSNAGNVFNETFSNIRTVRALTAEDYFHRKCLKATKRAFRIGLKRSGYAGFFFGLSDSGILFVTALIFWYGAQLAAADPSALKNILTVLTMLLFSTSNANAVIAFIPQISSSRTTATRLLRLSYLPYRNSHEHTGHARLAHLNQIDFDSVSLIYPSRPTFPALTSLSLTVDSVQSLALVGSSGSGKSSIASLLLGLYPISGGTITINGIPLHNAHLPTLRSHISFVSQQPTLFPASVADNITYALPEHSILTSANNIEAAAKAAGIHEFITSLPNGYATLIGPGGTGLSGGQQQRITIARAVARKPRLLILDEATSALDHETAGIIRALVGRLRREGVGVLAITHEKRMMEVCGEVAVVDEGRVVEKGSFGRLMRAEGSRLKRLLGEGD